MFITKQFGLMSPLAALLAISNCQPVSAEVAAEIALRTDAWTVTVQPATMRVSAEFPDGSNILVSAGQDGLGSVEGLRTSTSQASWRLPERGLSVRLILSGPDLAVDVRSDRDGQFTWPTVSMARPVVALIWPYWEGRYIPVDDARWQSFLTRHTWNTLDDLCMPFWGMQYSNRTITYIATNRFNNAILFSSADAGRQAAFTHEFPKSKTEWAYGFAIRLSENSSPVEPARQYRRWLIDRGDFVPMAEKIKRTPKVARLLGASHAYLWGDAILSLHDIKPQQWRAFCSALVTQARSGEPMVGGRIHKLMSSESWKQVEEIATLEWPHRYIKSQVCNELCRLLGRRDFFEAENWRGVELSDESIALLARDREQLSVVELCRLNSLLLEAAFPDAFLPVNDWGNGVSLKMLRQLRDAGLDRMRLCMGGWEGVEKRPSIARVANEMGYLFGTYDSFHSIHDPKLKGTDVSWPTAQFDRSLYKTGGIQNADGTMRGGFKKRGFLLSPHAARSKVEERVRANMANVPFNHYFIDCDAYGQVYDDYSPLHPSTQEEDAAARADRLTWIRDTFGVVIGSEGGCSYFAPVIHIAEGMLTPVIGWGDPDMEDRDSPYFVGAYYPPDGPRVFLQPVPLKDEYVYLHHDPRFILPLNEIVFHDSFVSTHHWGSSSLKFTNVRQILALREMLYLCPPLYHLNLDEFKNHRDRIVRHHAFFSPLHRDFGSSPMTAFEWLTPDRLVQRTTFDQRLEMIANFGERAYKKDGVAVLPRTVLARRLDTGNTQMYTPDH